MSDKSKELIEAAKRRAELNKKAEEEGNAPNRTGSNPETYMSDEEIAVAKEGAQEIADLKVQARAGTIDGKIDIEAMGDVKGDGRDAKDYDDSDPDKALGVPTWAHGLHATQMGVETTEDLKRRAGETFISEQTLAEQEAGRQSIARAARRTSDEQAAGARKTIVTDDELDPDGVEGKKRAEAAAKKRAEEAEAAEKQRLKDEAEASKKAAAKS